MKKLAAVLCLCAAVLCSACSQDLSASEFVGDWQATSAEKGGVRVSVADIHADFQMHLEGDGSAVLAIGGREQETTWEPTEDGKAFSLDSDEGTLTFTKIRDGAVKGELAGVTLTFEADDAS